MNILFISNGEAEDAIALSLIRYWLHIREDDRVAALAIAGSGKHYIANDIPLISRPMKLPSNGFAYQNWRLFYQDIEAGLVSHLYKQYKTLKKLSSQIDYIVGIGDIVPVIAARILGKPNAFIGCALSDYYIDPRKPKASSYAGLKRRFLKNMNSLVFPRDALTTNNLNRLGIRAEFQGNPMMDCIEYNKNLNLNLSKHARIIAVLPGSHDDARNNFRTIMSIAEKMPVKKPFTYLVAVADKDDVPRYGKDLSKSNWFIQKTSPKHAIWKNNKDEIHLLNGYFGNVLMSSHVVIGTSGTGNEQAVGIGIPTISFPCGTIQYTKRFGQAQQRLLGKALTFIPQSHPTPETLLKYIDRGFNNNEYREMVRNIALERFGEFGASERIVYRILQNITPQFG
jgi:uncharacterized protein (TIGR03492 family)